MNVNVTNVFVKSNRLELCDRHIDRWHNHAPGNCDEKRWHWRENVKFHISRWYVTFERWSVTSDGVICHISKCDKSHNNGPIVLDTFFCDSSHCNVTNHICAFSDVAVQKRCKVEGRGLRFPERFPEIIDVCWHECQESSYELRLPKMLNSQKQTTNKHC